MKFIVTNTVHISQNAIIEHKYKIVVTTHNMQYTHDFIGHIYEIIPLTLWRLQHIYGVVQYTYGFYNTHIEYTI